MFAVVVALALASVKVATVDAVTATTLLEELWAEVGGGWSPRKDSRAQGSLSKQHLIKF